MDDRHGKRMSAIFITFPGNCKRALTYYQACFGGSLHFETFEKELPGYSEKPVISGSLISDRITIYGSDLIHEEGRILGNYLSIFLPCKNPSDRETLIEKLRFNMRDMVSTKSSEEKLIEITDGFDVRWILSI